MTWPWLILIILCSAAIAYQDFKTRLISTWLILGFAVANVSFYFTEHSLQEFAENAVFCLAYFLFSYLVLHLYYYLKTKRFRKILDTKIGWGDVWIVLILGVCLQPLHLVWFFTSGFISAIFLQMLFFRRYKRIALAGMLVIFNLLYLFYSVL